MLPELSRCCSIRDTSILYTLYYRHQGMQEYFCTVKYSKINLIALLLFNVLFAVANWSTVLIQVLILNYYITKYNMLIMYYVSYIVLSLNQIYTLNYGWTPQKHMTQIKVCIIWISYARFTTFMYINYTVLPLNYNYV